MKPTSLKLLLNGITGEPEKDLLIESIVTDSRLVTKNSLFIAIRGENHNGHEFIEDAFKRGAVAAVVESKKNDNSGVQFKVKDTKDTYILIAKNYKEQFDPVSIGITGSVGKTTTKEMTASILEQAGSTVKNEGNLNNEIGLPQTMLRVNDETQYAVFEMGMNRPGDIRKLTNAVRPAAAIITGIGIAHIEFLKTKENILKAKLEIIEGMTQNGILVINGDDSLLMNARESLHVNTVSFGIENRDSDVMASNIFVRSNRCEFTIEDREYGNIEVMLPAIGNHYIMDALSAYSLTTRIGVCPVSAAKALAGYLPTGMRQKFINFEGITVIEDCYNANPDSMKAALHTLSVLPVNGLRIAVLGDMLELGKHTEQEHKNLGLYVAQSGIDVLLCYGEHIKETVKAAKALKVTSVEWFSDKCSLVEYLIATASEGDAVIFKASRGMKFEEIIQEFYEKRKF